MYTYLALLDEGVIYDKKIKSYFTSINIKIIKYYSFLNILKITSDYELKVETLKFVLSLELDSPEFKFE